MQGDIPYWGANSIVDHIDRWLFDEELVLLGEDGAPFFDQNREVAFTVNGKVWVNNHTHVLRSGPQVLAPFLSNVLNGVDYAAFIDGTTRDKLTQGDMNVIPVQLPPLNEQCAIAAFLDRETASINSFIAKKERLIELLQEKRTALISRAVTKGLDPDVPMKDSGVEWLGEIPVHWDVKRLKHVAAMRAGSSITGEDIEEAGDYAVFGGNGIRGYTSSFTHEGEYPLIGRQGALCGAVAVASGKFWASEHAIVVAPRGNVVPTWLAYGLEAMSLNRLSQSAAQPGLSVDKVGAVPTSFPKPSEQHAIASYLDRETANIDALIAKVREAIEHLKELRSALISAAVTGRIDVRKEAA